MNLSNEDETQESRTEAIQKRIEKLQEMIDKLVEQARTLENDDSDI